MRAHTRTHIYINMCIYIQETLSRQRKSHLSSVELLSAKEDEMRSLEDMLLAARKDADQLLDQNNKLSGSKRDLENRESDHTLKIHALQDQLVHAQVATASLRQNLRLAEEKEEGLALECNAQRLHAESLASEVDKMRHDAAEASLMLSTLKTDLADSQNKVASSERNVRALQQAISAIKHEAGVAEEHTGSELKQLQVRVCLLLT